MRIYAKDITKKFGKQKIINTFSYVFEPNTNYIISGANGSGKTTLLKIISLWMEPNHGKIIWEENGVQLKKKSEYELSFAAPYIDLSETSSVREIITVHFQSKKTITPLQEIFEIPFVKNNIDKWFRDLSSGMKQKLKLILALFSKVQVYLLDEPTSNLDSDSIEEYKNWIQELPKNRILIIATNSLTDFDFLEKNVPLKMG